MAKKPLCIDTDICIDFLRKKGKGYDMLIKAIARYHVHITAITAFELYLGHIKMFRENSFVIEGFISQFKLLPFDFPSSKASATIQAELDKQGQGIGVPDTLIAGICLANSMPLLTLNTKHFSRISDLILINL